MERGAFRRRADRALAILASAEFFVARIAPTTD
jgi:hypothetical protein